jgi:N-acetyl-gamma-glutamyl-phosphate reductase common form
MMAGKIGLIGGRGYVGETMLKLLMEHPELEPAWISSSSMSGQSVQSVYPDLALNLDFETVGPEDIGNKAADVVVLAMPNGVAPEYVAAARSEQKLIDISADFRFDDSWVYGLPEHNREQISGANRVSNPGCYATAVQLALAPLCDRLDGAASAFGISGFSGAGRTPSPRNDPGRLSNNIVPYSLSGHVHEHEVSRHLGHQVRFLPHVAGFFRGISLTVAATLTDATNPQELYELYRDFYANDELVDVTTIIPEIENIAATPRTLIGGFTVDERDGRQISFVSCLDNLLKGAASQAIQNINLMLGIDEYSGLTPRL